MLASSERAFVGWAGFGEPSTWLLRKVDNLEGCCVEEDESVVGTVTSNKQVKIRNSPLSGHDTWPAAEPCAQPDDESDAFHVVEIF